MSSRRLTAQRQLCRLVSPLTPPGTVLAPAAEDWPTLLELADRHMMMLELEAALHRHDLWNAAPAPVRELMTTLRDLHRQRLGRMRAQMREVTGALNQAGVTPVWLKGALELTTPDWADSNRMMLDIDMWIVDPADQRKAIDTLHAIGYRVPDSTSDAEWEGAHHFAPRVRKKTPVAVETHRSVIDPAYRAMLPDERAAAGIIWSDWEGLRIGRLGDSERVLHAMVQSTTMSIPAMRTGLMPLMKALDVVRLLSMLFGGSLPGHLADTLRAPAWAPYAPAHLTLLSELFGLPSPLPVDRRAVRWMDRALRYPRLAQMIDSVPRLSPGNLITKLLMRPDRFIDTAVTRLRRILFPRGRRR